MYKVFPIIGGATSAFSGSFTVMDLGIGLLVALPFTDTGQMRTFVNQCTD